MFTGGMDFGPWPMSVKNAALSLRIPALYTKAKATKKAVDDRTLRCAQETSGWYGSKFNRVTRTLVCSSFQGGGLVFLSQTNDCFWPPTRDEQGPSHD